MFLYSLPYLTCHFHWNLEELPLLVKHKKIHTEDKPRFAFDEAGWRKKTQTNPDLRLTKQDEEGWRSMNIPEEKPLKIDAETRDCCSAPLLQGWRRGLPTRERMRKRVNPDFRRRMKNDGTIALLCCRRGLRCCKKPRWNDEERWRGLCCCNDEERWLRKRALQEGSAAARNCKRVTLLPKRALLLQRWRTMERWFSSGRWFSSATMPRLEKGWKWGYFPLFSIHQHHRGYFRLLK